jgi:hypothetical protein
MPLLRPRSITSVLRWVLPLAMVLACAEHGTETPPNPSPSQAANVAETPPAGPIEATAPVTPPELATPTKPTEPSAPTGVVTPSDPTKLPEVATPTDPAKPTELVMSIDPTKPPEVATPTDPAKPAAPDDAEAGEPTDAERVDAYVASCSHRFTVVPEEWADEVDPADAAVDECEYYEWDQNCMPDPSGCWEGGQECIRSCATPCSTCQAECTGGCDQCKAACAPGATDCIRKCAEARLTCRNTCLTAHSNCQSIDCPKQEEQCNKVFDQKRKKKCPQCAAISACMSRDHGDEEYDKACARELPKAKKVCFDWCWEYYEEEE